MGLLPQPWRLETVALSPSTCQSHCLKKSVRPQSNDVCPVFFWRCDSLGVCSNGRAVDADLYSQQPERVHENLRRRYPALVNRDTALLQQDYTRSHTARTITKKFRNWEESNYYHTQHTALILLLQITICFDPWSISCVEEISKIEAVEVGLAELFVSKSTNWYLCGIINLAERWLKAIESDGLYFEE